MHLKASNYNKFQYRKNLIEHRRKGVLEQYEYSTRVCISISMTLLDIK